MKRVITISESELVEVIRKVITEQEDDQNTMILKKTGERFITGVVNLETGEILEVRSYDEMADADFHPEFVYPLEITEKVRDGECSFFWLGPEEQIHLEWDYYAPLELYLRLRKQIKFIQ